MNATRITSTIYVKLVLLGTLMPIPVSAQVISQAHQNAASTANTHIGASVAHSPSDVQEQSIQLHMYRLADKFIGELPTDSLAALRSLVKSINHAEERVTQNRIMGLDLKLVRSLPDGALSSIEPVFEDKGKLVLRISLVESMAKNPVLALETLAALNGIVKTESFQLKLEGPKSTHQHGAGDASPYQSRIVRHVLDKLGIRSVPRVNGSKPLIWAELQMNAQAGSRLAEKELAEINLLDARSARDSFESFELLKHVTDPVERIKIIQEIAVARGYEIPNTSSPSRAWSAYSRKRLESLQAEYEMKTLEANREAKAKRIILEDPERQKRLLGAEALPSKLNDYVQANDRENVARLLETYIPLATLEPVERTMWENYIEAIRNPRRDKEGTTILFRGTERINDAFRLAKDPNGNEVKSGMYSTLLARNQGNYTRRLRSFTTMRSRFAVPHDHRTPLSFISPKITHLLYNHSNNPSGSPFLSFSREPRIATMWADSALVAVNVDKRRVIGNVMSPFVNEVEILVPLLIFPEEIVVAKQPLKDKKISTQLIEEFFRDIEKLTGKPVSKSSMNAYGMHQEDFAQTFRDFGRAHDELGRRSTCRDLFSSKP